MNKLNSTLLLILLAGNLFASDKSIANPEITWLTDFKQALKESRDTQKPILIAFTGSDWCHACIKLKKEQFENDSFKKFASKNFILVLADFPRSQKNRLSPEQLSHNERLAEKYNPNGTLPFLVIVDEKEKVIGESVYQGKPEDFMRHLKSIMHHKKK